MRLTKNEIIYIYTNKLKNLRAKIKYPNNNNNNMLLVIKH